MVTGDIGPGSPQPFPAKAGNYSLIFRKSIPQQTIIMPVHRGKFPHIQMPGIIEMFNNCFQTFLGGVGGSCFCFCPPNKPR
jgi:hypothetical protein